MNVQTLLQSRAKTALVFIGLIALLWQLPLAAENTTPPPLPITQEISLMEAIHHIGEKYQVLFNYDRAIISDIKVNYKPSASHNVDEAISAVLENTDLKYQMFNKRYVVLYKNDKEGIESLKEMIQHFQKIVDDKNNELVIHEKIKPTPFLVTALHMDLLESKALSFSISGTVVDQEGAALIGVNIQVKGTNKGTATDFDGRFTLVDIDENAVLVVSYIGYQAQEVAVAGRVTLDIIMASDLQMLDEVVVVGYGTQKKINLTGSVSEIDFDNQLLNRPITNTSQALSGKVPGLWVSQNSGKPGDDDALLRIRGWGSLNASGPLVIIDGVEGSINSLNPQDIKSVSVLKDAASASIYGSKAANGVILVTTKSGELNSKPQLNFSSYYGIQSIGLNYDMVTNSATYMELWNQAEINSGRRPTFPDNVINDFRNNSDPYVYPNTNFDDYMYQNAPLINNNLSISGGSENSKYYISFNHQNQDGIILNTNSKKVGLSLNLESKVNNWISVGGRFHTRIKKTNEPYDMERIPYIWSNGGYPFIAPYTKEGLFGGVQALNEKGNPIVSNRNPVIEPYNGFQKSNIYLTRWTGYTDIKLLPGLLWKTNITALISTQDADKYNEGNLIGYTSNGKESPNIGLAGFSKFIATRSNVSNVTYVGFTTLNYNRKFNKNEIGIIAGTQLEDYERKTAFARSEEHPAPGITQVDGGTKITHAMGNKSGNRMLSYFGRANYAFDDKYLVELNIRADGSSRFAETKRWGVFPGISAGWRVGREEFMNDQNLFSDLKIRASSGKLGNQNIAGDWPYLSTLSQNYGLSYSFNESISPGAALTTLVNDEITWETTTVNDIGLEMFFINNRLKFESTVFNKRTDGIIVSLPIPKTMGNSGSPFENVGEMINNGVEFDLSYRNNAFDRNKFGYNLSVNFTYVVNEVTKFRGGKSPDQIYLIREGYSYKSLYAYNAVGIYRTDEEAKSHMHSNGYTPTAGDIKFEDINGDGRLDYQDKKVLGNSIPKINFGSNIGFSYYGFNLDVLIQGISGVTINYNDRWSMPLGASGGGIPKRWVNAWTPENPNSNLPALKFNDSWNLRRQSSFWAHDLTYMKIRNIQFGYTFPKNMDLLRNMDLNIYCNLQNYVTLTNKGYEGFDPEKNVFLFGNTGERGLSDVYPMPRIITVGINVNF